MTQEALSVVAQKIDSELEKYQKDIAKDPESHYDLARGIIFGVAAARHIVEKIFKENA